MGFKGPDGSSYVWYIVSVWNQHLLAICGITPCDAFMLDTKWQQK